MTEEFFEKKLAAHPIEAIPGVIKFDIPVHGDNRGWFKENFQKEKNASTGLSRKLFLQKENCKIMSHFLRKTFCVGFMQNLGTNTFQ